MLMQTDEAKSIPYCMIGAHSSGVRLYSLSSVMSCLSNPNRIPALNESPAPMVLTGVTGVVAKCLLPCGQNKSMPLLPNVQMKLGQ